MPSTSEIRRRIAGVRQTQKITHAMYLISSAKLRRARQELDRTRPYFDALGREIERIFRVDDGVESRYFRRSGTPEAGGACACLVITADKGLAGAYNHNVLKQAQRQLAEHPNTKLYVVGEFGRRWFDQRRTPIEHSFLYTAQNPNIYRAREIARVLLEAYESGAADEIDIIYTDMTSGMNETVQRMRLLPLERREGGENGSTETAIPFEPSLGAVLDSVVRSYISGYIYSALVDSFCSEQSARMAAMNAADENAEELLTQLSKQYNRARQAAITQEITEISAGARAQRNKKKEAQA